MINPRSRDTNVIITSTKDTTQSVRSLLDEYDCHISAVLPDIICHDNPLPERRQVLCKTGFPVAFRRDESQPAQKTKTKQSIFAQQLRKIDPSKLGIDSFISKLDMGADKADSAHQEQPDETLAALRNAGPRLVVGSSLPCAEREAWTIHDENMKRLEQLDRETIEKEREELLATVDPKLLAFLLRNDVLKRKPTAAPSNENAADNLNNFDVNLDKLPLKPDQKVPHMDNLEIDKLAWTVDLPATAKKPPTVKHVTDKTENDQCQARFDLQGLVVPPNLELDTKLGLHHHGDEPERAGYSLGELFSLARSAVPSQRRLAIATLADCIRLSRLGAHTNSLNPRSMPSLVASLVSCLLEDGQVNPTAGGVLFLLRWCLDEAVRDFSAAGSPGISLSLASSCLEAFSHLLYDSVNEPLLDTILPLQTKTFTGSMWDLLPPSIVRVAVDQSDTKLPARLRSHQYLAYHYFAKDCETSKGRKMPTDHNKSMQVDPICCLVKQTDLPRRIAWLLEFHLAEEGGLALLADDLYRWIPNILIRLCRHSRGLAYEVFKTAGLLNRLICITLPDCSTGKQIGAKTLKLLRVMAQSSHSILLSLVNDHNMAEKCVRYLLLGQVDDEVGRESLRFLYCAFNNSHSDRPHQLIRSIMMHSDQLGSKMLASLCFMTPSDTKRHLSIEWVYLLEQICSLELKEVCGFEDKFTSWRAKCTEQLKILFERILESFVRIKSPPTLAELRDLLEEQDLDLFVGMVNCFVRMEDHWTWFFRCFAEFMEGPLAGTLLKRFVGHESVLSGGPQQLFDVTQLIVAYPHSYMAAEIELTEKDTDRPASHEPLWSELPPEEPIDVNLIEPVALQGSSMPGLGLSVCFRHEHARASTLAAYFWPPVAPEDVKEPCATASRRRPLRFLPFVAAFAHVLVRATKEQPVSPSCLRLAQLFFPWLQRLDSRPWRRNNITFPGCDRPVLLHAMETKLAVQVTQALHRLRVRSGLEWPAGFSFTTHLNRLLNLLVVGQEAELPVVLSILEEHLLNTETDVTRDSFPVYRSHLQALGTRKKPGVSEPDSAEKAAFGEPLVPVDWLFAPMIYAFLRKEEPTGRSNEVELSLRFLACSEIATNVLQTGALAKWTPGDILVRLMCGIMAAPEQQCLGFNESANHLRLVLEATINKRPFEPFTDPCLNGCFLPPESASFYDTYVQYLEHYAAASYGSPVLAALVLWPCQHTGFDVKFRQALWSEEHLATLKGLTLTPTRDDCIVPLGSLVGQVEETDEAMLRLFTNGLLLSRVTFERQPLATLWAIHHVNRHIYAASSQNRWLIRALSFYKKRKSAIASQKPSGTTQAELFDVLRRYKLPVTDLSTRLDFHYCHSFTLYDEDDMPASRVEVARQLL